MEADLTLRGLKLRLARKYWNLKQADLAQALGVSRPTVMLWEKGAHRPQPDHEETIAQLVEGLLVPASLWHNNPHLPDWFLFEPDELAEYPPEQIADDPDWPQVLKGWRGEVLAALNYTGLYYDDDSCDLPEASALPERLHSMLPPRLAVPPESAIRGDKISDGKGLPETDHEDLPYRPLDENVGPMEVATTELYADETSKLEAFHLYPSQSQWVKEEAARLGISKAEVIRRAIQARMPARRPGKGGRDKD